MEKLMFKGVRTIILDYDGTLHDSTRNYIHAFKQAYAYLVEAGYAAPRDWADAEITKWLGYSSKAMWENFMPDLDEEIRSKASKMIGQILLEKAQTGQAILYEGSLETLQALKEKGYRLVFLSNCSRAYMEAHRESFGLDRYFDGMYCTEDFSFIPKYEIFESINRFPGGYLIVGDRFQDIEVAEHHPVSTVGCRYGFGFPGELDSADALIDDIRELNDLL
jgi:phosphoglycolate phosphatase